MICNRIRYYHISIVYTEETKLILRCWYLKHIKIKKRTSITCIRFYNQKNSESLFPSWFLTAFLSPEIAGCLLSGIYKPRLAAV